MKFFYLRIFFGEKIKKNNPPDFWTEHKKDLAYLFELQLILLNIRASSSFVEGFF